MMKITSPNPSRSQCGEACSSVYHYHANLIHTYLLYCWLSVQHCTSPLCITMYPSYLISPQVSPPQGKTIPSTQLPAGALMYCLKYCNTRERERRVLLNAGNPSTWLLNTAQTTSYITERSVFNIYLQNWLSTG